MMKRWPLFSSGSAWCLIAICLLVRAVVWFAYTPVPLGDTADYLACAGQIANADLASYDGRRMPVYPLLLAATGLHPRVIWAVQALLGVLASLFLFLVAEKDVRNRAISFLIAVIPSLYLNLLFMETSILTETLTRFLVVSTVLLVVWARSASGRKGTLLASGAGLTGTLAGLANPLYLYFTPLCAVFMFWKSSEGAMGASSRGVRSFGLLVPFVVLVGAVCVLNKAAVNYFGPTTMTGFNLINHSGVLMERAPDEYAVIRDVYVRYRDERHDSVETGTQTIWYAREEIQKKTGLSFVDLSRALTRLSVLLIREHPCGYMNHVAQSWVAFWRVPIYWHTEKINPAGLSKLLTACWRFEKMIGLLFNLAFLLIAPLALLKGIRRSTRDEWFVLCLMTSIVLATSMVQALVDYGQNPRHLLPVQPLVFYTVIVSTVKLWRARPVAS